jgi:hypothetical protein
MRKTNEKFANLSDLLRLKSPFLSLKTYFFEEYKNYHLCESAVSILCSYLQQYFASHPNILNDYNQELMDLFSEWQDILKCCTISLTTNDSSLGKLDLNYYDYLIWTTFMPLVQKTIK